MEIITNHKFLGKFFIDVVSGSRKEATSAEEKEECQTLEKITKNMYKSYIQLSTHDLT